MKTNADQLARMKVRREAERLMLGDEAYLQKMRESQARYRDLRKAKDPDGYRESRKRWKTKKLRGRLCLRARKRGLEKGMPSTIKKEDVYWPTHCPVLGIELDYATPPGNRIPNTPNLPSLDRWDNTIGYVPGNVYVISLRANSLKSNATVAEMEAVLNYMKRAAYAETLEDLLR